MTNYQEGRLWVGNLFREVTFEALYNVFRPFGALSSLSLLPNRSAMNKRAAMVTFDIEGAGILAYDYLNGKSVPGISNSLNIQVKNQVRRLSLNGK